MKTESILEIVRRKPFRPFQIEVTSGNWYLVESADHVGCTADGGMMFLFPPNGRATRIDADEIAEIHEMPKATAG